MSKPSRARTLFVAFMALSALAWCVQFTARASPGSAPTGVTLASPLAAFAGDAPITNRGEWAARRAPLLRQAFLANIYGALPRTSARGSTQRTLDTAAFDGAAQLDQVTLELDAQSSAPLEVALLTPTGAGPFPLIILSDFCGLDRDIDPRLPAPSWRPERCRSELGRGLTQLSHGDAILRPPVRAMIARGYAIAVFFPGDVAPDDPILFREAQVNRLGIDQDGGAIADWASLYLSVFEALRLDPRVSSTRVAFWGHSRYGKAALLAAALDDRVWAVVANQSGTYGATLASATRGESSAQIVNRFPHWFPTYFAGATTSRDLDGLDQHLLLALLAPRPVLLGNAGLDRWSDPAAAFAAARAASDAYALFGSAGLAQPNMREPDLSADIAFYVRPGGHGVRSSDWAMALDFLDLHFRSSGS